MNEIIHFGGQEEKIMEKTVMKNSALQTDEKTVKRYEQFVYEKTFEGTVKACRKREDGRYDVILDRTAFYPEGGGQPFDTGTLGGTTVLEVHERNGEIIHTVENPLETGCVVTGEINWERRYRHMQLHSGEHLLSGLIHQEYGYDNVGFHMGSAEVTIDFNGVLSEEQVAELEERANRMIYENLPIEAFFPSSDELKDLDYRSKKELSGKIRIVRIPGGDICACCGTHVNRTGEIGILKVTALTRYKGGARLSMLCGLDALHHYRRRLNQVTELSGLLSAKPDEVVEAVRRIKSENEKKSGQIGSLYYQLMEWKVKGFPDSQKFLFVEEQDMEPVQLRQYCTMLYERGKGKTVLVCSKRDELYQYAIGSKVLDMRVLSKQLNQCLGGRGGGSSLMAQGTFAAPAEKIREVFLKEGKKEIVDGD